MPFEKVAEAPARRARAISIEPRRFDTPCTLKIPYIQDINGLCSTSGCMPAASAGVNFRNPINNKKTTNPYLEIEIPSLSNLNCVLADRYDAAITSFMPEFAISFIRGSRHHKSESRVSTSNCEGFGSRQRRHAGPDLSHQVLKDGHEVARPEGSSSEALFSESENRQPPVALFEAQRAEHAGA
jgi:hypothetical protein